jgi:tripartite-type tricarboxylate transporter receptor subunit TctC
MFMIACAVALLGMAPASAQTYPTKPIRIVVPFSAGGAVDLLARIMGQKLSESLGQSVIIENRPGAGGLVYTIAGRYGFVFLEEKGNWKSNCPL